MKKAILRGSIILLLLSIPALSAVKASPSEGPTIKFMGREWDHDPLKVYIQASP
jgi:hypothetical protein